MAREIDIHVGERIRSRRQVRRLTQGELAKSVGVKFQQIQKYETGTNRVSASCLWDIANELGVKVSYFFPRQRKDSTRLIPGVPNEFLDEAETVELIQKLHSLDPDKRTQIGVIIDSFLP